MAEQVQEATGKEARRALLIEFMEDPNPGVRKCAAIGLEKLEAAEALDGMVERIRSGSTAEAVEAVYALAKVPGDQALRVITNLLKHESEDIRAAAARVLEEAADPRTTRYLVELLNDASYTVRGIAVDALAKLKDRKVVPFLLQQLGAPDDAFVERIVRALGDLGDPRSEAPLMKVSRHKNPKVRGLALIALGNLALDEKG